jgi:hypothetical protein
VPSAWGPDDPALIRAGTFEPGSDNYVGQPPARAVRYGTHRWRFPILFFGVAIAWTLLLGPGGAASALWIVVVGIFPVLWGWGLRPLRARMLAHEVLTHAAEHDPDSAAALAGFRWVHPGEVWRAAIVVVEVIAVAVLFHRYVW